MPEPTPAEPKNGLTSEVDEKEAAAKAELEKKEAAAKAELEKKEAAAKAEREKIELAAKAEREKIELAAKAEREKTELAAKAERAKREADRNAELQKRGWLKRLWHRVSTFWKEYDDAFDARIAVVRGMIERNNSKEANALRQDLQRLKDKTETDRADLMELQDIEAEAIFYADKDALYAVYVRLKDRCYRLSKSVRATWQAELERHFKDPKKLDDEALVRRRLADLTREIASDTAEYVRKTKEKASVLLRLSLLCVLVVILFLWVCIHFLPRGAELGFMDLAISVGFAGGIGAAISALRGMGNEKLRTENTRLLSVRYSIRSFLGLFYATFVLACVLAELLPLRVPEQKLPFLLALGFVSGFSDALFAQTVSRFTQPSEENS